MLASRDRWTRDKLLAHQSHALAELRAVALARSSFYGEFHRGLEAAPLEALPVLTKASLVRGLRRAGGQGFGLLLTM